MDQKDKNEDDLLIRAMIDKGDIIENGGNLWDLELPTVSIAGRNKTLEILKVSKRLPKMIKSWVR